MSPVDDFQAATEELAAQTQARVLAMYATWQAAQITQLDAEAAIAGIVNRANAAAVTLADAFITAQIEALSGTPTSATGILPADHGERLAKAVHTILTAPPKTKLTRTEIREAITDYGLNPKDWDVAAVTTATNQSIRASLIELQDDDDEWTADDREAVHNEHGRLMGVDFLEKVLENAPDDAPWQELSDELEAGRYDGLPPVWEATAADAETRLSRLARAEPLETAQKASIEAIANQDVVEGWTRQMDADPCQLCVWWWREGRVWPKAHPFQSHKGCNCQPRVVLSKSIQTTGYTRRLERALAPSGTRFTR